MQKNLSNSCWIQWGPAGGFKAFGSGLESCSWELCVRCFAPTHLTRLFCLEVREPLRNRKRQFRKQTLTQKVAMDVFLYCFKETRSHGLLQSERRCSFGWNEMGLPPQASCAAAHHKPSPVEHIRDGSALRVEAQQGSYLVLGRNSQAAVLFLLSKWYLKNLNGPFKEAVLP